MFNLFQVRASCLYFYFFVNKTKSKNVWIKLRQGKENIVCFYNFFWTFQLSKQTRDGDSCWPGHKLRNRKIKITHTIPYCVKVRERFICDSFQIVIFVLLLWFYSEFNLLDYSQRFTGRDSFWPILLGCCNKFNY